MYKAVTEDLAEDSIVLYISWVKSSSASGEIKVKKVTYISKIRKLPASLTKDFFKGI